MRGEIFPRPILLRNVGFWLLAMLLGSLLLPLGLAATGNLELLFMAPVIALLAAELALAALPLLLPTLPWALTADSVPGRWGRLLLQSVTLLLVLLWCWLSEGDEFVSLGWVVGPIFSLGGLLAAWLVYRPWLGSSAGLPTEAENRPV